MRTISVILAASLLSACTSADRNTDWPVYLGDVGRRHYSELDQITRDNVSQLELAWVYDAGELRGSGSTMYTSPLVIDGVLYGLSPRLVAFALNAATGRELWRFDPGLDGAAQRGLMWWEHAGDTRLFYTAGRELLAVNAADGTPVESFGDNGRLDLTPGGDRTGSLSRHRAGRRLRGPDHPRVFHQRVSERVSRLSPRLQRPRWSAGLAVQHHSSSRRCWFRDLGRRVAGRRGRRERVDRHDPR